MDFNYLSYLEQEYRFDEIKVIGRTVQIQDRPCHFMAMTRKQDSDAVQLFVLAQTDPEAWNGLARKNGTMRESVKADASLSDSCGDISIEKLKVNDLVLNVRTQASGSLETSIGEGMALAFRLMEAGWRLPEDDIFFQTGWNRLMLIKCEFHAPASALPDWEGAQAVLTLSSRLKRYVIEKPVSLTVTDDAQEIRGEKEIAFTLAGEDGQARDGVCYINRVYLADMYKQEEERFADPQYRRRALEHMTEEEFEQMKQQCLNAMEQQCPRGMRYLAVEYECTLDVNLEFYSSEYLASSLGGCSTESSAASGDGVTFLMVSMKPDHELGTHGLRLRACLIQTPVPSDTKQMQAELFVADETVPGYDVKL